MKLKYSLLLLGLLLIPSYSMAINNINTVGLGEDLGGQNYCTINSDLSFSCSQSDNILVMSAVGDGYNVSSSFFRTNVGLGFYTYNGITTQNTIQGIITGFTFCEYDFIGNNSLLIGEPASIYWPASCFTRTYTYKEFKDYASSHQLKGWGIASFFNTVGGPVFIFEDGAFRLGFGINGSEYQNLYYGTYYLSDLGLSGPGLSADYSNIPVMDSPNISYYTSSDCPSVGQLKKGYGLNPNVCYAGFDSTDLYGDSSVFRGGQGMDIFSVYNMYSGGTYLQSWYDTFWGYYQSLTQSQENNFIFSGGNIYSPGTASKALLGLQFARQNFGQGKTSYQILNYCYYVVNNIPDNTSSCVSNSVNNTYPNVQMSSSDYQNIMDDLYTDYDVHISGEGSPFFMSGGNFGTFGQLFSGFFNLFNSSMTKTDFSGVGDGILPYYIGLAFIIVVLYGILTR